MDLRVSVILLFIFLTGGYSLKCYSCRPDETGFCEDKVETCPDEYTSCASSTVEQSYGASYLTYTTKRCTSNCGTLTKQLTIDQKTTNYCCNTDLCNAADGVYKGSFLLLLSPLLFYFLFH
ncbi:prostate stem cell antigen-like [Pseudorasbora parva]|uniref:prostate stem cell antigen-like n=1 Tax=Pseudorasbora parva TaxID=51549 RepID=UPI00351EC93B